MAYRAVKANDSNKILAIGNDENQGGKDYNGIGVWMDWTFDTMPDAAQEVKDHIAKMREQGLDYILPVVEISADGKGFAQVAIADVQTKADSAITAAKAFTAGT